MPQYEVTQKAMVWREIAPVGGQMGYVDPGITADSSDERVGDDGYTYCYFASIDGKKGWVYKARLKLVTVTPPPPPPADTPSISADITATVTDMGDADGVYKAAGVKLVKS